MRCEVVVNWVESMVNCLIFADRESDDLVDKMCLNVDSLRGFGFRFLVAF